MNPEIEARLQALRPAAPPEDLRNRLLESEPPAPGKIRWLRLLALPAAAAAVAVLVALPLWRARHPIKTLTVGAAAPATPEFLVFVPIERTRTVLDMQSIAFSDADPAHPVRFVRATWLDDTTYAGDDGRSTMRRREPRTAILSIPLKSL